MFFKWFNQPAAANHRRLFTKSQRCTNLYLSQFFMFFQTSEQFFLIPLLKIEAFFSSFEPFLTDQQANGELFQAWTFLFVPLKCLALWERLCVFDNSWIDLCSHRNHVKHANIAAMWKAFPASENLSRRTSRSWNEEMSSLNMKVKVMEKLHNYLHIISSIIICTCNCLVW